MARKESQNRRATVHQEGISSACTKASPGIQFHWIIILSASLAFAVSYFREFVFPHVPILGWGDQLVFATAGTRILAGQMTYRDYFQFMTPCTDLVYAALFRWFGISIWVPSAAMVFLASASVLLLTWAAGRVLRGAFAILPALLTIGFLFFGSMDATHHWFSTVIVMAAMLMLMAGTDFWQIGVAGALCGVAAGFTQSKGGLATVGFLIYLIWQSSLEKVPAKKAIQRYLLLCGTALISLLAINVRYIQAIGIRRWIDYVIIFPIRYYTSMPSNNWHSPWIEFQSGSGHTKWILAAFLYGVVPIVYMTFLLNMRRWQRIEEAVFWRQLMVIAITGIAMFAGVAQSLSVKRASSVSLPAMILLVWMLCRCGISGRITAWTAAVISLVIGLHLPFQVQHNHWNYIDLPAGKTAILDREEYELYRWMAEHTRPGDPYYGMVQVSLPLRLQCPAPIDAPGPWKFYRPEAIAQSIDAVEKKRVQWLVLRTYGPNTPGYTPGYLESFDSWIDQHYRMVRRFSPEYAVWERRDLQQPDIVPR